MASILTPLFPNAKPYWETDAAYKGLDMSGYNPGGAQTMDMADYYINGVKKTGSSSAASGLQKYLESKGQGSAFSWGKNMIGELPENRKPDLGFGVDVGSIRQISPSNNPYGFTGGAGGRAITPWTNSITGETWNAPSTGYQPPNSNWQRNSGQKANNLGNQSNIFQNNTMGNSQPSNFWGAPDAYRNSFQLTDVKQTNSGNQSNIFENPYSAGGNNFYNPYQFGQTIPGSQYSEGTELPWWQNYNTGGTGVTPPTVTPPTTPTQPTGNGGGGGGQGKDLTYAETIKEMGLYPNAEKAFEAGDNQAAYRQDHMQWRSGTGAWAGNGKQEGQSDLDYPGRTTDAGDVIMGDRQKLTNLSGMFGNIPDNLKALFSGGGSGMNSNFLNQERGVEGSLPYNPVRDTAMQSYLDDSQKYSMRNYDVDSLLAMEASGALPSNITRVIDGDVDPFNQGSNYNYTTPSPYTPRYPSPFNQNSNYEYFQDLGGNEPLIMSEPMSIEDQARNGTNRSLFGIGKENFVPETRYGVNNSRELIESNLFGVNKPTAVEDAYNQRRLLLMRQESEKQAAMAESKRAAEEYEAKNRAEAAAKAAAEKARQATAAQARMNNRYETGPVPKNIFTSGTGGSSSGRGSRAGRTAPAAPKATPKKETTTRRYTGRYGL